MKYENINAMLFLVCFFYNTGEDRSRCSQECSLKGTVRLKLQFPVFSVIEMNLK